MTTVTENVIPLSLPFTDEKEIEAATAVIKSGWLTHGPRNHEFEEMFASFVGVKRAVSLNSCTSALHLAVEGLGIKGEVIVPGFTFVASANAVITAGAKPAFADVDYTTCNLDPEDLEQRITSRTEAIMPVHYAGQTCDMDRIQAIARKHNLAIIEDCAETIGGTFKNKVAGSFGPGCFSFFPTKNIAIGEGGMLTTDDDALADRVRALCGHGISSTTFAREKSERPWFRSASFAGYNFRLSNLQAAIGIEQMKKLEWMNQQRIAHSKYLIEQLKDVEELVLPVEQANRKHVYQMFTIKLRTLNREKFVTDLRARGISASVHFDPPVHKHAYYVESGYGNISLPVTEKLSATIVSLPMYPHLSQDQLDTIVRVVRELAGKA